MKLREIKKILPKSMIVGDLDIEITDMVVDSRQVVPGCCFIAMKGTAVDGSQFIDQAIEKGACVIVSGKAPETRHLKESLGWVHVQDCQNAAAKLTSAWFGEPSKEMAVVGVTGTNGKTTTTFLLQSIMRSAWHRAGLIGTVVFDDGVERIEATHTTPGPLELQACLQKMLENGCRGLALEVSSHAIDQQRIAGIAFDVGVFSNLTQDHLDYHKTMDQYFEAKEKFFAQMSAMPAGKKPIAVINLDDVYGLRLVEKYKTVPGMTLRTYGFAVAADFRANNLRMSAKSSDFELSYKGKSYLVRVPLIGRFNIYNSLAAIAAAVSVGIPARDVVKYLGDVPQVPGRLELVNNRGNFQVFVDYAHTPDALENVCKVLKDLPGAARLITVFGCGGDRDRKKRPLMAAAAARFSDVSILTSDNPRSESPEAILAEIERGMGSAKYLKIVDRREAITAALNLAKNDDVVLIAGKGHENYQEFSDGRIEFDDVNEVKKALRELFYEKAAEEKAASEQQQQEKPRRNN